MIQEPNAKRQCADGSKAGQTVLSSELQNCVVKAALPEGIRPANAENILQLRIGVCLKSQFVSLKKHLSLMAIRKGTMLL